MRSILFRFNNDEVGRIGVAVRSSSHWVLNLVSFGILLLAGCENEFQTKEHECAMQLREIGEAVSRYREIEGRLPATSIYTSEGKALHSWRVLLLPYLEANYFYGLYNLDQPWDGEDNSKLLQRYTVEVAGVEREVTAVSSVYCCGTADGHNYRTNFVALDDADATLRPYRSRTARVGWMSRSSPEDAIVIVAVTDASAHWMKPEDLTAAEFASLETQARRIATSSESIRGAVVVQRDGSAEHLAGPEALQYLRNRSDRGRKRDGR